MGTRIVRAALQASAALLLISCAAPSSSPQAIQRLDPAELAALEAARAARPLSLDEIVRPRHGPGAGHQDVEGDVALAPALAGLQPVEGHLVGAVPVQHLGDGGGRELRLAQDAVEMLGGDFVAQRKTVPAGIEHFFQAAQFFGVR